MRLAATVIILLAAAPACTAQVSRARYLMGTVCEVSIDGGVEPEKQIARAFAEAARIEGFLSTWREGSELSRLNRSGDLVVSPELSALLRLVADQSRRTGARFNPLMRPLIDAWKTRSAGASPSREAIDLAMKAIAPSNLRFVEPSRVVLINGAKFEEGGFGKGYAIDRMLAGITSRRALINFGGQIGVRGEREVTIADPAGRDRPVVSFTIHDASLSTSSGSEKTFVIGGRTLSHIIDPRTGEPLPPRGSASAISSDALSADILSTALYVMGPEEGIRWANANGVAAAFIGESFIYVSKPFRERAREIDVLDRNFILKD